MEVGSRYGKSIGKDFKGGVNVITDDSVGWGADIGIGTWVCKDVGREVNMSKVEYLCTFLEVYIEVVEGLFLMGLVLALVRK